MGHSRVPEGIWFKASRNFQNIVGKTERGIFTSVRGTCVGSNRFYRWNCPQSQLWDSHPHPLTWGRTRSNGAGQIPGACTLPGQSNSTTKALHHSQELSRRMQIDTLSWGGTSDLLPDPALCSLHCPARVIVLQICLLSLSGHCVCSSSGREKRW